MKQRKLTRIGSVILIGLLTVLLQACGEEVGGNEDDISPVTVLTSLNDGEEVIGTFPITWSTNEANRSTVDLYISNDSGATWALMKSSLPDTGRFMWDSNEVEDCRTCRMRVIQRDVVGNVGAPADSARDFIVNNVPQVLGIAFYRDVGNDGPGDGDEMRVPFDKDLELRTSIASDIFAFPVLGDSVGSFAEISRNPSNPRELLITMNDLSSFGFHLHVRGLFDPNKLGRTAPSGINLLSNISEGVIFAPDTGRTADAAASGIDIVPTFNDSGQTVGDLFSNTTSGALGDIDGDDDLDLVIGNLTGPNQVLRNDGDGNFSEDIPPQALGPGNRFTMAMGLGDLDGDGDLDLIEGSRTGGNFADNQVWLNGGTGPGTNTGMFILGDVLEDGVEARPGQDDNNTVAIALGDLDGDGRLDVVEGNRTDGPRLYPNRVFLNDGAGNFTATLQSLGNNDTTSVALGDIDGDGDLDLVEGIDSGQPNQVWINDGLNSASFSPGQILDSPGNNDTTSVALGDVDGDDDLDLVTGNNFGESNRVWLNNIDNTPGQEGVFTDSGQSLGSSSTEALALSDVDDDGDLDLVVDNRNTEPDKVWLNGGDSSGSNTGVFSDSGQAIPDTGTLGFVAMGDVDGDGGIDLVANNKVFFNSLVTTDLFVEANQLQDNSKAFDAGLGDIDGDGDLDLVASNRVWFNGGDNTGSNTGVFSRGQALGDSDTRSVTLGDIDGDGDLDLVLGNRGDDDLLEILLNTGRDSGVFSLIRTLVNATGSNRALSIALGDIDGDGDDLNGDGVCDVDSDGDGNCDLDLDLIVVRERRAPQIWLNGGDNSGSNTGEFPAPALALTLPSSISNPEITSFVVGDIDGDDDLDLVAGNIDIFNDATNIVWLNGGDSSGNNSGVFGAGQLLDGMGRNFRTNSIALGDVDGDDDLDLVEGNSGQGNRVLLNGGDDSGSNTGIFIDSGQSLLLPSPANNSTQSVALGDVDGDGDLDLLEGNGDVTTSNDFPEPNRVWLNGGDSSGSNTGVFVYSGPELGNDSSASLVAGDLDGDGDLDHIDVGGFRSTVWLNDF